MAKTLAQGHIATECRSWDLKVLKPLETDLSVLCPSTHPPPPLNLCMAAGNDAATGEPPKVHGHLKKQLSEHLVCELLRWNQNMRDANSGRVSSPEMSTKVPKVTQLLWVDGVLKLRSAFLVGSYTSCLEGTCPTPGPRTHPAHQHLPVQL